MKHLFLIPDLAVTAACAGAPDYGPAGSGRAGGHVSRKTGPGRNRVSGTVRVPVRARHRALLRASEPAFQEGGDGFGITRETPDAGAAGRSTGPSVSIGGPAGPGGYPDAGPLSGPVPVSPSRRPGRHWPGRAQACDARSAEINLRGASG